jgi:ELWxxDGT repeat protein
MPKPSALAILLAAVLSAPILAAPAAPYLVKDLNQTVPENVGSVPIPLGVAGGRAVFSTLKGQLWASDGTPEGTRLLKEPAPSRGQVNKDGEAGAQALKVAGGRIFFLDRSSGRFELWATDGTPKGTAKLVSNVELLNPQSYPWVYFWSDALHLFFFSALDTVHGQEAWVSNGTPTGTHLLRDILPGTASSGASDFADAGSAVVFSADGGSKAAKVWRTDGTEAGTVPVPGSEHLYGYDFFSIGRKAVFTLFGGTVFQVWATDGTARGTTRLANITGVREDWDLIFLGTTTGRAYFYTDEGTAGYRLWTTDGTTAGTRVLGRFPRPPYLYGNPRGLEFLPNRTALFFISDGAHGMEWWRSDGTVAGTRLLKDACPGSCSSFGYPLPRPVLVGNKLFAHLYDPKGGLEPWLSDGTEAGTRRIADTCPGACSSSTYSHFAAGSLEMYSARLDGENPDLIDLWRTDGTSSGTFRLVQSQNAKNFLSLPGIALGNQLLFANDDGVHGMELWATDGTLAGTRLVADLDGTDQAGSVPSQLTPVGDRVFFVADDGAHGKALWVSDGTPGGTSVVHALAAPPANSSDEPFNLLTAWNGRLIFVLIEGLTPPRLWVSDGTAEGTQPISEIIPQLQLTRFMPLGNRLLFSADHTLWVSDGTAAGTARVTTRVLSDGSAYYPTAQRFATLGDQLLFNGSGAEGDGLWKSDGTDAGTVLVKPLELGLTDWAVLGGNVYFYASGADGTGFYTSDGTAQGTRRVEIPIAGASSITAAGGRFFVMQPLTGIKAVLWVTDMTAAGTHKVAEVDAGFAGQQSAFTAAGNQVFFLAYDDVHGVELWRSDGTAAGTFMVQDLNPGPSSSSPGGLSAVDGVVYFNAYENRHGIELWRSDGTPGGTFQLSDIAPGPRSSSPQELAPAGPRLFFSADDGTHGFEPWALCLTVDGCGP